jgi:hypothetical protein
MQKMNIHAAIILLAVLNGLLVDISKPAKNVGNTDIKDRLNVIGHTFYGLITSNSFQYIFASEAGEQSDDFESRVIFFNLIPISNLHKILYL